LFSDAKAAKAIQKDIRNAEKRVNKLKDRLRRALTKPSVHDPLYKVCQRSFHKNHSLLLSRESEDKVAIRRKAFRRFIYGYPPRKHGDTSIGDAVNWEWIIRCAKDSGAEIHIASRDSDYGVTFENKAYINDHLLQEFRERISRQRGIFLHTRLSEGLKLFAVPVTREEEEEEDIIRTEHSIKAFPAGGYLITSSNTINCPKCSGKTFPSRQGIHPEVGLVQWHQCSACGFQIPGEEPAG
jgi:PIN domain